MRFIPFLMLATSCLALTACASTMRVEPRPGLAVSNFTELPPPVLDAETGYRIGILDKISIDVIGIPELSKEEIEVDSTGRISAPLAGSTVAAGRTPDEVAKSIEDALAQRYVRNPRVTVSIVETRSRNVTVDGEVKRPGIYPIRGRSSLLQAIAAAEGTSEYANARTVVIYRTVGDQRMAGVYDLASIRRGIYDDPAVYADDVIVLGEDRARRRFQDLLQILPAVTTPLILLLTR